MRAKWPPAMWPVSCAITPITWPALSARIKRPVVMNRFWPWATKALSERSLTSRMRTALGCRPAAFQSGVAIVRMIASTSVSRIRDRRSCARAGEATAAIATAPAAIEATKRFSKDRSSLSSPLTKRHPGWRQLALPLRFFVLVVALSAAGCNAGSFFRTTNAGYAGAVVADEPHAALVGREVLTQGGSAGDAAVATYFALSVTLPSTAGLGGGGVCVAYDPLKKRMEVIDFLPRPTAGGAMAVPANLRRIALLH